MKIIDAQLHDPAPWLDWTSEDARLGQNILTEVVLAYLDALGVAGVVIAAGDREWAATAARGMPERISYVPMITPAVGDVEAAVAEAAKQRADGLVALRAIIGWPLDGSEVRRFDDGEWDSVFAACERHGMPLFFFTSGYLSRAAVMAERHPDLTLVVDHLGLRQPPMDTAESPPFASLPELLDLARFPNVAVKLCGLPALSREAYPFADVVPHLRSIVDAFGAERVMWASDIGRFYGRIGLGRHLNPAAQGEYPGRHTYAESLGFVRYCEALSPEEKDWILGGSVRALLGWPGDSDR